MTTAIGGSFLILNKILYFPQSAGSFGPLYPGNFEETGEPLELKKSC
jgi:hypothetical protein